MLSYRKLALGLVVALGLAACSPRLAAQVRARLRSAGTAAADTTAPTTTLTTPASCAFDAGAASTVTIAGSSADNVAVSFVRVTNTTTSVSVDVSTTSTYSTSVTIQNGSNAITATAYDTGGNADASPSACTVTTTYGGGLTVYLRSSLTTAEGWDADYTQTQWSGKQTGLSMEGSWTAGPGNTPSLIGNSGSGPASPCFGGRTLRVYSGAGNSDVSSGLRFTLSPTRSEIYARYYIRYETGFGWTSKQWTKEVYGHTASPLKYFILGWAFSGAGDYINMAVESESGINVNDATLPWNTFAGGATHDGAWDRVEFHIKTDTGSDNGIVEVRVNGTDYIARATGITFGAGNFSTLDFGENQNNPNAGGGVLYREYAELVIADGWIGACDAARGF